MEINNSNINRVANTQIAKTEKSKLSQQQETKDLSNCPNPAEYLGRSQVIFKGKLNTNLKPIVLKESPLISKEESLEVLKELSYTEEEISQIDFDNEKIIKGLSGLKSYLETESIKKQKDEILNDFKSRSSDYRMEFVNDDVVDMADIVIYANQENIDTLSKYIDYQPDNLLEILGNIFSTDNQDNMLKNIPLAFHTKGKLNDRDIYSLRYANIETSSFERADILRKINEFFPENEKLQLAQCDNLGADEELTPENIQNYLKILEKYSQKPSFDINSLKPSYEQRTLKEITNSMREIDSVLDKYPIDFESSDENFKITRPAIEKLTGRADIAEVQKYINSLSKEAKAVGINNLPEETSELDKTKIAQICNIISEKDYGKACAPALFEYLRTNSENIDGIIKLIQRYKGTDTLNTNYMDRVLTVGGNDYDNAITALDLKDEIDAKNLHLSDYNFYEVLHNPESNLEDVNKILTYIKDNTVYNGGAFLSAPKGYNKLVLEQNIGKNLYYDRKTELYSLGEMLNNDEELNYAIDLIEQKRYPDSQDSSLRFGWDFNAIKEIMQSYQNDKESTKAIVEMKNKNGYWAVRDKGDILQTVQAYQLDKNTTLDILKLNRFYNGHDIRALVETAQIDKDYTLYLINLKNEFSRRKEYRFDANDVSNIVQSAQIDKDLTEHLLAQKYTDEYGTERYRIHNSEDYIYFAQKAQEDKEYVTSLFELKEKNYDGTEKPRFNSQTIKAILDNPHENKEFLLNLINQKKIEWGRKQNVYSGYDILEIARAAQINKTLTENLINEKIYVTNYNKEKEEYPRFNRVSDLTYIVQKSVVDPEFTKDLLGYTEKHWNGDILPRFDKDDIIYLLNLREKGVTKEEINSYINETSLAYDNRIIPRFNAGEIYTILNLKRTNPELIDTLLKQKALSDSGKEFPLYNVGDLQYIVDAMSRNKEYASQLLEKNPTLKSELRLSGLSILQLTEAANIDADFTNKLLNMRRIDKNGKEKYKFESEEINKLVSYNIQNKDFVYEILDKTCKRNGKENVSQFNSANEIIMLTDSANIDKEFTRELISLKNSDGEPAFSAQTIHNIISNISYEEFKELQNKIGDVISSCNDTDIITAVQFKGFYGLQSINEVPITMKKDMLKNLVATNADLFNMSDVMKEHFPLIPTNTEEYCKTLPMLVRSIGIETNELSDKDIQRFNKNINNLSEILANLTDEEFNELEIKQEYPKDEFIKDVLSKLNKANLSLKEQQRVFDYYGFELHSNPNNPSGYSIVGYPVNLNNGKKLAEIKDAKTKEVVEDLRKTVIKFSENNEIKSNNKTIQKAMNNIVSVLPEIRTMIDKKEDDLHNFDVMKHSLKLMQKVSQDSEFLRLSDSDKKIMLLGTLMHNISKTEGFEDLTTANESSFDTFFIAKKFQLTKDEEIKLYTLIKHQDWLKSINDTVDENAKTKTKQSVAFDLQQGNNFDMATIFAKANITTLKSDQNELQNILETAIPEIKELVGTLKKTQPLLPTTKMPKASTIEKAISYVNNDGSTNIKGVYKDSSGLIVVKFNEVNDWESIGLPKGSTNKGIKVKAIENINGEQVERETETGNIKFFVHGLDYANQLAKFDAFSLVNSDALLSVSYAERPETKFRFFRPQGVMLDVPADYVYGGGNTDSGSGCGKSIDNFKNGYVFGGYREADREYVSNLIKEETGMNDEEYVEFFENNKDKPMTEIEPKELREKLIQKLATMNSNHRLGNRAYNEMYISNPKSVMGVFAYNMNDGEAIEEPLAFLEQENARTDFLKEYALEHDVPFYVFGD